MERLCLFCDNNDYLECWFMMIALKVANQPNLSVPTKHKLISYFRDYARTSFYCGNVNFDPEYSGKDTL